jgi:hypothetical protein
VSLHYKIKAVKYDMDLWQEDIINKLIGLTNQYILPPIDRKDKNLWIIETFLPPTFSGIGMTWAITNKGKKIINQIVSLLRVNVEFLKNSRRNVLVNNIQIFYKDIYRDKEVFDGDRMFFSLKYPGTTLLDCTMFVNKYDFGVWIYNKLFKFLFERITKQLLFIPLYRINFESRSYTNNSISVFNKNENNILKCYENEYTALSFFDLNNVTIDGKPIMFIDSEQVTAWFCMEYLGDLESNLNQINKHIRIFLSLLFAEASESNKNFNTISYSVAFNRIIIFDQKKIVKEIGTNNLQHNFAGVINVSDENISRIFKALKKVEKLKNEDFNRFSLFCEYFIKSLNTIEEERIINQFIGIDALWGIENKNEISICSGIESVLKNDKKKEEKAKMLYKLRCELIHGGSYMIDSWCLYDTYINKFNTEPEDDLMLIFITKFKEYLFL